MCNQMLLSLGHVPTGDGEAWRAMVQQLLWAAHTTLCSAFAGMNNDADLQALGYAL